MPNSDAASVPEPVQETCRECGEPFEEDENAVPSRSILGGPLVHEECA